MTATARADNDGYKLVTQVNVPLNAYTCTFPASTHAVNGTSGFTFDISLVDQSTGQYLLADSSHGRPSSNTEGGMLSGATSGDVLVINTDNPGAGYTTLLPPPNDPFAGHRCDSNTNFGGVPGPSDRNEISGPNGALLVNDTQVWVGDGPSYFTPGQTNSASDYKNDPCDSSVRVFSLITKKQIAHINTHGCFRTDEGTFDAVDQIVLIANPSEQDSVQDIDPHARYVDHAPFVSLISARPERGDGDHDWDDIFARDHYRILSQINFDGNNGTIDATGGIEQAVYSRQTGLFYIATPANNNPGTVGTQSADGFVVVVDPHSEKVVGNYALKSGSCPGGPTGAALGPNEELLLGCGGGGGEVVVNVGNIASSTANPTILADGSVGCDEVSYDAASGHFGGACRTATSHGAFELLVSDAHSEQFDVQLTGAPGAHSVAADSINGQFWMPMVGGACNPTPAPTTPVACVAVYAPTANDDFNEASSTP